MRLDTPCIGICSSVYGDPICRGCKRTAHEVIAWNQFTPAEKTLIYQRLHETMAAVLLNYIEIDDADLLYEKITQLKIRLHSQASQVEQAFHLLRLGADKIKNLTRYGLSVKSQFNHLSLPVLFAQIDREVYAKANEHL